MSEENKTFAKPDATSSWEYKCLYEHYQILESRASQFESTLRETMRVRDERIQRLERALAKCKEQRDVVYAGTRRYASRMVRLDEIIEAILKGEAESE